MPTERNPQEWDLVVRQQAALARLGQFGMRSQDLDELLAEALRVAGETLGVSDAIVFELVDGNRTIAGRMGLTAEGIVPRARSSRLRLPAGRSSFPGYVLEEDTALVSDDLLTDSRFVARAPEFGISVRSAVLAPIGIEGRPYGVLGLYDRSVRRWTADDVAFVQSVAGTIGLAVLRERAEQALRDSSARLDLSLDAGGLGAWSWDLGSDQVSLGTSTLAIYGFEGEPVRSGTEFLSVVHPDDRRRLRGEVFMAVETGEDPNLLYRIRRRGDGAIRWIESRGRIIDVDGGQHMVGVSVDVTERRLADQDRDDMLRREREARREAEKARERLAFLAAAGDRLGASLDLHATLETVVDLCVPAVADICLVDIADDEGRLVELAGRAVDDESLVNIRALRTKRAELGGKGGVWSEQEIANANRSIRHQILTEEQYRAASVDEEHLAMFHRLGGTSAVVAPLVARDRVVGVITLVNNRSPRVFLSDEQELIEDLAARAALAIDNTMLFEARNRVARSLQSALLPPALPAIAGLEVAARYQVADTDTIIGGDFYDVIEMGEREWAIVVGDVCGRGPDAAALTGLMRHSLRAAVVHQRCPASVLAQTNAAVLGQIDESKFATATMLRVDLPEVPGAPVAVVAAGAGHPRPVVVRSDGTAGLLECRGTLLGVVEDPVLVNVEVTLAAGDSIVLYTDGVTEARRNGELFGDDRLVETVAGLAGRSADDLAGGLAAAVADYRTEASDDLAVVVLGVPAPGGAGR